MGVVVRRYVKGSEFRYKSFNWRKKGEHVVLMVCSFKGLAL